MKTQAVLGVVFMVLTISFSLRGQEPSGRSLNPSLTATQKSLKRHALYEEGQKLEKEGLYQGALLKYEAMISSTLLTFDYNAGMGRYCILRIHIKQGQFEKALEELQWFLAKNPEKYQDEKNELEALIKARDTNNPKPVYEHIKYLGDKYKKVLPPQSTVASLFVPATIIRLYDHVGDYDGGIHFIDRFIEYYAAKRHVKPENIGSKNQYFIIKQAFLEDEKEKRPSCVSSKPGEVCMGRATKALIQSGYFPW